jgi:hypothetical protein
MDNTVISRVDQPKVSAVSRTDDFVAVFFLAWFGLIFVLGARGVFVAPSGGATARTADVARAASSREQSDNVTITVPRGSGRR